MYNLNKPKSFSPSELSEEGRHLSLGLKLYGYLIAILSSPMTSFLPSEDNLT